MQLGIFLLNLLLDRGKFFVLTLLNQENTCHDDKHCDTHIDPESVFLLYFVAHFGHLLLCYLAHFIHLYAILSHQWLRQS